MAANNVADIAGTVSFNKKIYKPRAVKRAVREYSEFADFTVKELKNSVRVTISGVAAGRMDELKGEFCNYALYLMKAMQV